MTASYTFDVFSTVDGYGSYTEAGDWGGYWGKHGPEFLDLRLNLYGQKQRLVLGANTFRQFVQLMGPMTGELKDLDPVNAQMRSLPTTVVSTTRARRTSRVSPRSIGASPVGRPPAASQPTSPSSACAARPASLPTAWPATQTSSSTAPAPT